MRVEALLLQDHLTVVVLALRVGQAHHGQQFGAAQRAQDIRVVVQSEDGFQELKHIFRLIPSLIHISAVEVFKANFINVTL